MKKTSSTQSGKSSRQALQAMTDKYEPIPSEIDTIDCLRKERDELKVENEELKELLAEKENQIKDLKSKMEDMIIDPTIGGT